MESLYMCNNFLKSFSLCLVECINVDHWDTESIPYQKGIHVRWLVVGKFLSSVVWGSSSLRGCCVEGVTQYPNFYPTKRIIWYSGHFWTSLGWPPMTTGFADSKQSKHAQPYLGGGEVLESWRPAWETEGKPTFRGYGKNSAFPFGKKTNSEFNSKGAKTAQASPPPPDPWTPTTCSLVPLD